MEEMFNDNYTMRAGFAIGKHFRERNQPAADRWRTTHP